MSTTYDPCDYCRHVEDLKAYPGCMYDQCAKQNTRLRRALSDAIDRPKGVVPDSALEFYDGGKGEVKGVEDEKVF